MIQINKLKHFINHKTYCSVVYVLARSEQLELFIFYYFGIIQKTWLCCYKKENETILVIGNKQLRLDGMKNSTIRQFEYNFKHQK